MRSVFWFETLTRVWTAWVFLGKIVLGQRVNIDIIRGSLVYFEEVDGPSQRQSLAGSGRGYQPQRLREPTTFDIDHQHKHYFKGAQSFVRRRQLSETDLPPNRRGRQGQQCRARCTYIPDRDFCSTDIIEEIEADDYYDYSRENSIEYSEEYYSDEDYYDNEDYEDDRRGRGRGQRSRLKLTSSEDRGVGFASRNGENNENGVRNRTGVRSGNRNNFHVVYPSLTKFAASRDISRRKVARGDVEKNLRRNKAAARRRSRMRRLRQQGRVVRLRPSALEQETIIRWDRVVERGPYIGGDIVVPEGVLLRPPSFGYIRNQWPEGVVPFKIDPSLNSCRMNAIFDAMDEIEGKTCISFVERKKERNFIDIKRTRFGCSSYVGMIGGAQHLNLSTGCFSKFTVVHELMHALGFDHEQSRKDRDKFIEVNFDNVLIEKEAQFELNPTFTGAGFPYDLRSIMHYSAFLFAKNKCEPTIYPVNEDINLCDLGLGNGKGGMTDCDAAKVNRMYKCGRKYSKKCKFRR